MNKSPLIFLASASPRRRELLQQIGVSFELIKTDVDETPLLNENPTAYVKRLAQAKASAGWQQVEQGLLRLPVLGADTTVVCDGKFLGKPRDKNDVISMLTLLSGRTHQVLSGVAMVYEQKILSRVSVTDVTFNKITTTQIEAYWQTGEPMDKAGSYAIQGFAAIFVKEIKGSFSNVVGLPLYETAELLQAFNIPVWWSRHE